MKEHVRKKDIRVYQFDKLFIMTQTDPANAAIIVQNGGIALIVSCLTSPVENTVLSAIAALYYLCTPSTKKEMLTTEVLDCLKTYAAEGLVHLRIRNIAKVFLSMHGS
ncbi:hypothetical protein O6H91_Y439100 [Diphasiastrum complanatum]|nr:hypothetical protein O6H91_Y439100 [Diphasiastrum complanatum]